MRIRSTPVLATASLLAALVACSGCALGTADPLLYDEAGLQRESIGIDELEEADIPWGCSGMLDDLEGPTLVRIPVEGGGGPVLVGVGALALCVDDGDPAGGDDPPLPEYDPGEPVGLGGGQVGHQGEEDGGEGSGDGGDGVGTGTTVGLRTRPTQGLEGGNEPGPDSLLADPTPQPITD